MKRLFLLFLLIPCLSIAQKRGINFEHNSNWQKVKAKAKSENKHIFVDCFTTWCGPCRYMSENVFVLDQVGEFFNNNFVNVKLQFDETKDDSEDIKSWFPTAELFETEYNVSAYPTFLVFNPNGELVDKVIGGNEADAFIETFKNSLIPEKQFITIKKKFEANPNDLNSAKSILSKSIELNDMDLANIALNTILQKSTIQELFNDGNFENLVGLTQYQGVDSKAFHLLYDNLSLSNTAFEKQYGVNINEFLTSIILQFDLDLQSDNLDESIKNLSQKYPKLNFTNTLNDIKINNAFSNQDWQTIVKLVDERIQNDSKIKAELLNEYSWAIFENCDDQDILKAATTWAKIAVDKSQEGYIIDTYANLLYKTGDKNNAILWQEKAVANSTPDRKEELQSTLDKMKKGIPTW